MKKILIVNSNYYKSISDSLVKNAKKKIFFSKFALSKIDVPGIFEIPITIRKNIKKFDAFIALGCVIKGETPHFDLICLSTFNAILKLSIDFNKPISNGIITALNMRQAIERSVNSSSKRPNKGAEAANAIISILKNGSKKI
jgi:6,7-dimethyl-8-ribityllumazine synthase